ncbi:MAG: hypothetical protein U5L03_03050 [Burkholderiaceae bacterium]|nr:hypothetical protein [Burkholderiaceae bacterium]
MKATLRVTALALLAVTATLHVHDAAAQGWTWRATLYGWFPSIRSETQSFDTGGGQRVLIEVDPGSYLSNLQSGFMGSIEARKGSWSFIGDAIYLNLGDTKSRVKSIIGPGGAIAVPLQTRIETDLEGAVVTVAAGHRIAAAEQPVDLVFGLRHGRVKPSLAWDFGVQVGTLARTESAEAPERFTDAIVGLRGRAAFDGPWFVPYHVDLGTGSSRLTWQAMAGVGYRFGWGEASLVYRHLAYDFKSDSAISDLGFSGPAIGASFAF